MSESDRQLTGPDLAAGVEAESLRDGATMVGHANGEAVILARQGREVFAVGATCTHYGGPLGEGIVVGDTVRCPLHHACFSMRTGEAVRAPALNPIPCFDVREQDGKLYVLGKRSAPAKATPPSPPASVVIVGAGAAGNAAAEMLRREGYEGSVTLVGADEFAPCDRPNLSKDYLAGTASEDWIPLRTSSFYEEQKIALRVAARVHRIDPGEHRVELDDGTRLPYGALLLATGATPVPLQVPGAALATRALPAHARGQPRNRRAGREREARRRSRSELHRPRGRGVTSRARPRGSRGGAGRAAARASHGGRGLRLRQGAPRGARRRLPFAGAAGERSTSGG